MTPASPHDKNVDVSELLNENVPGKDGLDPDSVDANFEQELEDLFADDLEDAPSDGNDGPVVLDEVVEDDVIVLDDVIESTDDATQEIETPVVEEFDDDDELIVLEDIVEEDSDEPLILDDEVPVVSDEKVAEVEALIDDIAEVSEPEFEPESAEEIIELDDLVIESESADDAIPELDELLDEADSFGDGTDVIPESQSDSDADALLDDESESESEENFSVSENITENEPVESFVEDIPVEQAVSEAAIDSIMDEPESESDVEPTAEKVPASAVVAGNVFNQIRKNTQDSTEVDSDLTGLEALENDAIEDVDSLLDHVDVSDVIDAESDDGLGMDIAVEDFEDVEIPERVSPDAEYDMADDLDVDGLLEDVCSETEAATIAELQDTVAALESRVEDLEKRLRDDIAQMVPAVAARIIREEIVALANDLDE
ncbi:hypothetical protein GO013_09625 [Pseudodesulfovibrio sp. JC047]|uniref:hypothetical protein n=1 Tax=Pseudodesulfovibrio sp. JC047 TaxID=2683199 RepID=UPI0013CFAFD9|nr:hypothetical protein [Pseudodesulfovibrio sp. JC047]NDV19677.1 hypothetical protein [Pseudodesulfovibrio sp. JC047]